MTGPAVPGLAGSGEGVKAPGRFTRASKLAAKATWLLDIGIMTNTVLLTTTGFGDPDEGDQFKTGASRLVRAKEMLASASTDGSWSGYGAQAYASRLEYQIKHTNKMHDADLEIRRILQKLAVTVTQVRITLGASEAFLGACIPVALALYAIPVVGPERSLIFQIAALIVTIPMSLSVFGRLATISQVSARDVRGATNDYNVVTAAPKFSGTSFASSMGASAMVAASMSSLVGGVEGEAPGTGEGSSADGRPVWPSMPILSTPTTPTRGGVAGLGAVGPLGQPAGQGGQPPVGTNRVTAPAQQVRRAVPTAQQGVSPVDDRGAGAAPSAVDAERAPIDVASSDAGRGSGPDRNRALG